MNSWIALFQFEDRYFLQENLNIYYRDYIVEETRVWTESGFWFASVIYKYKEENKDGKE